MTHGLSTSNKKESMIMKHFKIVLEVELKDGSLSYNDFIYKAIEEQLEPLETILDYELEEITE